MTTITPADMKKLEAEFMETHQIPSMLLMERAAMGVCDALAKLIPQNGKVLFLVGPGNNGGDGYAAARIWMERGGKALLWEMTAPVTPDAKANRTMYLLHDGAMVAANDIPAALGNCDGVCDALFGTGLSREVSHEIQDVFSLVRAAQLPVVAVDIPSGLSGLTGDILGDCLKADITVTFHAIKDGLLLKNGPDVCGQIMVQPILIPKDTTIPSMTYMTEDQLHALLPTRKATLHKGSAGRVVLYCGSVGMCGAAAFCAKAAMKGGAGLVAILARESIASILQLLVPECVLTILPEENGKLAEAALPLIRQKLAWADSAVIGCGIADDDDNLQVLSQFKEASCPVVWDATALTLLARHDELLPLKNADVITPHPGEAARLLRCDAAAIIEDPRSTLTSLQQKCGCIALLKGARTLMTDGETTAVNIHGSPALAKGGSGDVLAGLLGAYMVHMKAKNLTIVQAAVLAHSLAGETYAALHGEYGMTQQALIDCIYSGTKEEEP